MLVIIISDASAFETFELTRGNERKSKYFACNLHLKFLSCIIVLSFSRPTDNIQGFTYQTLIELTANIESQELRRQQNSDIGYPEHPRAATTDDNECFFSIVRRHLGGTFTLKQFQISFPKLVR